MSGSVSLRAATPDDCERVYAWNFAPDVRAVSGDPTVVALPAHAAWFARRLAAADAPMWIVEADGHPVGVVRIDADRTGGRISIALGPEARGHGIGRRAIAAACAAWNGRVTARIQCSNYPSRAAFEACGFLPHTRDAGVVTYQWSPA